MSNLQNGKRFVKQADDQTDTWDVKGCPFDQAAQQRDGSADYQVRVSRPYIMSPPSTLKTEALYIFETMVNS